MTRMLPPRAAPTADGSYVIDPTILPTPLPTDVTIEPDAEPEEEVA